MKIAKSYIIAMIVCGIANALSGSISIVALFAVISGLDFDIQNIIPYFFICGFSQIGMVMATKTELNCQYNQGYIDGRNSR